jgi:cyclase
MTRTITLVVLIVVGALCVAVTQAQQDPSALRIEKVKDTLYVITGGRGTGSNIGGVAGNTTVFLADSGVVLVDTKYQGYGSRILEQVKSVTTKPVTTIINTHTHGDHTGGNGEFPKNVEFVAQANTRANMARMDDFKGEKAALLPKKTFTDKLSVLDGKDRIDLYYFGAGHTNGDAVIVFPSLRTVVMGDLFARKWAPLVDASNGGSAVAFPQTLSKTIGTLKGIDTVITGHATTTSGTGGAATFTRSNPVMKWADLQEYAAFMRDFVAAAQAAQKAGKSVDDAVTNLNLPTTYRDYNMAQAKADVQRVYDESKK